MDTKTMRVRINLFHGDGVWYNSDTITIPNDAHYKDFGKYLPNDELTELLVVTDGPTPWGYPAMSPAGAVRGNKETEQ